MSIRFDFPYEGPFFTESFIFNGGEVQVRIPDETANAIRSSKHATVTARISSSDDLMELIMVVDAYKRINPQADYSLNLPYLPYSRQDRVANPGEALSAKVFADMINALNFKKVFTYDAHSDVGVACLNNCESYDQTMILSDIFHHGEMNDYMLVSPDAGATKKTLKVAQYFGGLNVINCDKVRDTKTGKITGTYVNQGHRVAGESLLIVDDICDGGMTFIKLAEALHKYSPKSIDLYVTHGIFSKGKDVLFNAGISHVYTTDSFPNDVIGSGISSRVTVHAL